ncbi:MAG TPA: PEP-CTERM sorting domain-containing protein [Isosphaeraceae bacterium]|nr:PEP-CTERM sorting domain-containing protein [Isosphaeraceae bacterium]
MNGFTRAPRWIIESSLFWLGLILIGAGGLGFERVDAAPIHKDHLAREAQEAALGGAGRSWPEYLMGGPSVWSHVIHPPVTPAVESAIWKAIKTDPGETSSWVQFLLYKQSLDPVRFAHFHPKLSQSLNTLSAPPTGAQVVNPAPSSPSTGGTSSPETEGQQIPGVPEPAPWLLTLAMAGWAAWWRRHKS